MISEKRIHKAIDRVFERALDFDNDHIFALSIIHAVVNSLKEQEQKRINTLNGQGKL